MAKKLEDVEAHEYELEVFECFCGFHIGLDATFIDQVRDVTIDCPACGREISTDEKGDEDE